VTSSFIFFTSNFNEISAITPDDGVNGVQYLDGDWSIINFAQSYDDEIIYLTGNITCWNLLTLTNTTVSINSFPWIMHYVNIQSSNSNLTLKDNSVFTANNTDYPYDFILNTGSRAFIENSEISYVGSVGSLSEGLLVQSSSVTIDNSLITNNYNGIVCFSSPTPITPRIVNSRIENSVNKDIVLKGNSHPIVINTTFNKSKVEVLDDSSLVIKWLFSISVKNQSSTETLSNVKVTLKNATGDIKATKFTDDQGYISKIILPESEIRASGIINHSPYSIELEKDNFATRVIDNIEIDRSKSSEFEMSLKPQNGKIDGNVTDEEGNPIEDIQISVFRDDKEIAVEYSNETGQYTIPAIPEFDNYTLIAKDSGEPPEYLEESRSNVKVIAANVTVVDFKLKIRPLPVTVVPVDGATEVPLTTNITAIFEDRIRTSSLKDNFKLYNNDTGDEIEGTWNATDNKIFVFAPDSPLSYGTLYLIVISKLIENISNERPMWKDFRSYFLTKFEPPKVENRNPEGINIKIDQKITISFTQPMNTSSVENAITIKPTPTDKITFTWGPSLDDPKIVTIDFQLLEGTTYNVTIGTTATSMFGMKLESPVTWEFITETNALIGRVIDEDGNALGGVRVTKVGPSPQPFVHTQDDGSFTLGNLPVGFVTINITLNEYDSIEETLTIVPGLNNMGTRTLIKTAPPDEQKDDKDEEEEEPTGQLLAAYTIAIILVLIILIIIVFMALSDRKDEPAVREERVDFIELGREREAEEEPGEEEMGPPPAPPYRGRCQTCNHTVYGDAGCFYCATGGRSSSYMYSSDEGEVQ
jgi:hypothetical protein